MLGISVPERKSLISFSLHASIFFVILRDCRFTTPVLMTVPASEPPVDHAKALKPGSPFAVEQVLSPGIFTTKLLCARAGTANNTNATAYKQIFMEPPSESAAERGLACFGEGACSLAHRMPGSNQVFRPSSPWKVPALAAHIGVISPKLGTLGR